MQHATDTATVASPAIARFFEVSADAMCVATLDGRFIRVNPAFARLLGVEASAVAQRSALELVHPDDRDATAGALVRLRAGEQVVRFENRFRRSDGAWRTLSWSATPADGQIYASARDCSPDDLGTALDAGGGVTRAVLHLACDAVEELDLHGRLRATVLGPAIGADAAAWVERWHPDDRAAAAAALGAARAGGSGRFEARGTGAGAAERWFEVTLGALVDGGGTVDRLVALTRDITLEHAACERVAAQARDAQRLGSELEHFAYGAAHDLQEPLRMVSNYVHLLQTRYGEALDERARGYMRFAIEGAVRMQALIRSLLDYSRLDRDSEAVADVALGEIVAEATTQLSSAIAAAGALVDVGPLPTLRARRGQMLQLMRHLLANAVLYRRVGHAPTITVSAAHADGVCTITVRDDGIGIDPRHHQHVFEVFKRLHSRDEYPGAGIGLALCRKIVHGHGGRIWVESQADAGAAFRFSLPG